MIELFTAYQHLFLGLSIFSVCLFLASLAAVPWLIAQLPPDYFITLGIEKPPQGTRARTVGIWLLRNIIGGGLFAMGVIMLFIPGQGLLTMVAGLLVMQFPGKRAAVLYLTGHHGIQKGLNWIRKKKSCPPLKFPDF